MNELGDNLICHVCQKTFSSVSSKNKHLRSIHQEDVKRKPRSTLHIHCPVCTDENKESFGSHDLLISHLEKIHCIIVKTSIHNFRTMEEFETWRAHISTGVDYVIHSTNIEPRSNIKRIYYNCNRSNYKGFVSKCSQRRMKTGGSIRISGWCPSRICVKICDSEITVKYTETHVGHTKHLTQSRQQKIANQLIARVKKEEVLQDSRVMTDEEVERVNILNNGENEASTSKDADSCRKKEVTYERACMLLKLLNDDSLYKITNLIEKMYTEQINACNSRKRKMDKQLHYPTKK